MVFIQREIPDGDRSLSETASWLVEGKTLNVHLQFSAVVSVIFVLKCSDVTDHMTWLNDILKPTTLPMSLSSQSEL